MWIWKGSFSMNVFLRNVEIAAVKGIPKIEIGPWLDCVATINCGVKVSAHNFHLYDDVKSAVAYLEGIVKKVWCKPLCNIDWIKYKIRWDKNKSMSSLLFDLERIFQMHSIFIEISYLVLSKIGKISSD